MKPVNRVRFRLNPSNVAVPMGFGDLYLDSNGNLVRELPEGATEIIGTAETTESVLTLLQGDVADPTKIGIEYLPLDLHQTDDPGQISTAVNGGNIDTSGGGGDLNTQAGGSLYTGSGDLNGPNVSGTIPAVPSYTDETAANAALAVGDFYWNVALGKLRTATA